VDGASTAMAEVAHLLGACQGQVLAQQVEKRAAGGDPNTISSAVDSQGDLRALLAACCHYGTTLTTQSVVMISFLYPTSSQTL
jgi:hypothetical protein